MKHIDVHFRSYNLQRMTHSIKLEASSKRRVFTENCAKLIDISSSSLRHLNTVHENNSKT